MFLRALVIVDDDLMLIWSGRVKWFLYLYGLREVEKIAEYETGR